MSIVTFALIDTPDGRVAVHSSYRPLAGQACSPAESAALEIMNRTRKDWGIEPQTWARTAVETPEGLCRALLTPEDLGYSVSPEVRDRARLAMGLPAVETTKVHAT